MSEELNNSTGAVSHTQTDWHSIDWQKANENVRRLQARIVKATQEKRWNKVKALQHLLTHSFSGKAIAVRRVTENTGKNTSGVDNQLLETPESKWKVTRNLKRRGYKPLPLKRVYIPKATGKPRPLGIPTMKDRAMQALHLLALDPVAETLADPNSYGFRKERCCADAIGQCFNLLHRKGQAQWILEGDIKSCFDKISHEWLLENVQMDKLTLKKWLKAGYMEKTAFFETDEGTPQGGIISPVLANIALDGLEREIRKQFPQRAGAVQKQKVYFVRYADDFIITGESKELLETRLKPLVEAFMQKRGLELSQEKTVITHIEEGFNFLGQNVRKYHNGKNLLITPSKKNVKTFLEDIRETVKENATATAANLIIALNRKIWGWSNYHRHVVSKDTFTNVDSAIYQCLWNWAKRRHPGRSRRWIKDKYFTSKGLRNWVFYADVKEINAVKRIYLTSAATTPIKRHVKIKGEANPYDPAFEIYFENRLDVKMENNLRGRRKLLNLWKQQNGVCPICQQKITKITGWHSHHIIWRSKGGKDGNLNRVLLHPNCHRQVHANGLTVEKPRSTKSVKEA
jgi:RNA-directed DNA polymerase